MTRAARANHTSLTRRLITPGEAARTLGVSTRTLLRYADQGTITRVTTPGGTSRYWEDEVQHLLKAGGGQ